MDDEYLIDDAEELNEDGYFNNNSEELEEDPDEEDDDTIYHTCIVCGATTRDCKIWFPGCNDNYTDSLYGYDTRIFTTVQKARAKYDEILKEAPGISTEDMVKRLVSHFIGPSAAKKLKLVKENTNHGEW